MVDLDGEIRVAELTGNDIADDDIADRLLEQELAEIESFLRDDVYDKRKVLEACRKKEA